DHMFELAPEEVEAMVRSGDGPSASHLRRRAERRRRLASLDPPLHLGPDEPAPPLEILSPPHQVMVGAVQTVLSHMGMSDTVESAPSTALRGVGIGDAAYRGTARV